MMRRGGWWGIVALGLTLVAAWAISAPERSAGIGVTRPALPATNFVPVPIHETGEARDRAIFREILRAQSLSTREARRTALPSEGERWPFLPSSPRKLQSRSMALAAELAARSAHQIARAYGMTDSDLKALYQRGNAAGWGPH